MVKQTVCMKCIVYITVYCSDQWIIEKSYGSGEETVEVTGGPGADRTDWQCSGDNDYHFNQTTFFCPLL